MISVEQVGQVSDELVEAYQRLLPQLSSTAKPPSAVDLEEVISSPGTVMFVARTDDGDILGSLTLVVFRIPTGLRAWIEDVVVDSASRGHGVGEALSRSALSRAAAMGAKTVELTSRPSRGAANRLYQRIGFEKRETNLYRIELEPPE